MKVREISCGKMHELAIALDKAGFDSELIQKIINSEDNKLAEAMYAAIVEKKITAEPTEKFGLLVDLGILTVPDNYVQGKQLGSMNRKDFIYFDSDITDKNFSNPTRVLKPGDKFHVLAYKQIVPGETTSEERMEFLAKQKAVLTGAQGASLVYQQKRNLLPKGFWYCSFDEKKRLWKDAGGGRRVPYVRAFSDGDFEFNLGYFERPWNAHNGVLLCFCDVPAEQQA